MALVLGWMNKSLPAPPVPGNTEFEALRQPVLRRDRRTEGDNRQRRDKVEAGAGEEERDRGQDTCR